MRTRRGRGARARGALVIFILMLGSSTACSAGRDDAGDAATGGAGGGILPPGAIERSCVIWPEEVAGLPDRCRATYAMSALDLAAAVQERWTAAGVRHSCSRSHEGVASHGVHDDVQATCTFRDVADWSGDAVVRIIAAPSRIAQLETAEGRRALSKECCSVLEMTRRD